MKVEPYLFDGRCEEAFAFYSKALGAEVLVLQFMTEPSCVRWRLPLSA